MLSPQQIEKFQRDGFVKGSQVLDEAQVETLRTEMLRVIEKQDELEQNGRRKPVQIVNLTGKADNPVWQVVNIWLASEPFEQLVHNPVLAQEAAQLTGASELRLWHDQIQFKPAQTGGVNMWHQDSPLWPSVEPKTEQVTAWVALDDVDEDNGCMRMVPGSHRWGPRMDFLNTLRDFNEMPEEFEGSPIEVVSCPVKKGEVHFHHALCWHGSGLNTSGRPRRAIALHFMTQATNYTGGGHVMKPYIHNEIGQKITGDMFPQVWPQN